MLTLKKNKTEETGHIKQTQRGQLALRSSSVDTMLR